MRDKLKFSLIIPTLNRPEVLRETLESVFAQDLLPDKIYIVDQSDDDKTKRVCEGFSDVIYIHSSIRSGTHSRNIAIQASIEAGMDFWCFLDDDVILDEGYFRIIFDAFSSNNSIVGIAAWVRLPVQSARSGAANFLRCIGGFDYYSKQMKMRRNFLAALPESPPKETLKINLMPGCAMAVRNLRGKNIFFDEKLILYALAEDRDFSYRLSKLGSLVLIPNLGLLHKATPEGRIPSRKKTFMTAVHHYYLMKKNFGNAASSALMFWWNMAMRCAVSLLVTLCGLIKGDSEMLRGGKDIRDSFAYLARNRKQIASGDLGAFHEFLLSK